MAKTPYKKLDKDLERIAQIEEAAHISGRPVTRIGTALLFLVVVWGFAAALTGGVANGSFIVAAAVIGGYMAMNIGANDVANNVGPAVGSRALSMAGALLIAALFEAAGALIAGGDVVSTISKGIVTPDAFLDPQTFIHAMTGALLSAALWIHLATMLGAPVSTTHSIVGGVLGAGAAAAGMSAVNWPVMGAIAASWVISPLMGGAIAAGFLFLIKTVIVNKEDKIAAARQWVPLLIAIMAGAFTVYLVSKGLKQVWRIPEWVAVTSGVLMFLVAHLLSKPYVARRSVGLENRNKAVASLFTLPLICSAALLSFAHGANDVANAVGPLAAVVSVAGGGEIAAAAAIPGWVMLVGAVGIALGLMLFGPKMIRTVGQEITKLDPMRAYCVALSAAITVIIASALGLPVSSTHIAIGGVFGVGFLREHLSNRKRRLADVAAEAAAAAAAAGGSPRDPDREEAKLIKAERRRLVRRRHVLGIAAAWVVTVPASALLAAGLYWLLHVFVAG